MGFIKLKTDVGSVVVNVDYIVAIGEGRENKCNVVLREGCTIEKVDHTIDEIVSMLKSLESPLPDVEHDGGWEHH